MNKSLSSCYIIYYTIYGYLLILYKGGIYIVEDEDFIIDLSNYLDSNGEIKISNEDQSISIQFVEDKSYSFVSNNHKRFYNSTEAIEWAVMQFDGSDNITEWE